MAGLFDEFAKSFESEDDQEASPDTVSQAVVASLSDDDIDEELSEAEKRLAKAAYYKAIVRNGVIEDDGTPQSTEVNAEARVWARQMMGKLLGLAQPEPVAAVKVEPQFTDNEVKALKSLAKFALAKMGELPADPVVKKVEAPPTPTVRKVAAQQQPQQPKKPSAPAAAKPQAPKPKTPPPAAGKKAKSVAIKADGTPDYAKYQKSGEPFKDVDGNVYRFVGNPRFDPEKKDSKPYTKLKITNQVRANGALPMPTNEQMKSISASQSMDTINTGASASATSPFGADKEATTNIFVAAAAKSLQGE